MEDDSPGEYCYCLDFYDSNPPKHIIDELSYNLPEWYDSDKALSEYIRDNYAEYNEDSMPEISEEANSINAKIRKFNSKVKRFR